MRKIITSLLLALCLLLPSLPISAAETEEGTITAKVSGTRSESEAQFVVALQNKSVVKGTARVMLAAYSEAGELVDLDIERVTLSPEEGAVREYFADITKNTARVLVWEEKGVTPLCDSVASGDLTYADSERTEIALTGENVWASYEPESANPASNAVDGDSSTAWTANGFSSEKTESLTAYLGEDCILTDVSLTFGLGGEREYIFSVETSFDGESFTEVIPETTALKTASAQRYAFDPVCARCLRVVMHGRTDGGSWVQLAEVKAYGSTGVFTKENTADDFDDLSDWQVTPMGEMTYTDYEPILGNKLYAVASDGTMTLFDAVDRTACTYEKLNASTVTASQAPETANAPANVLDGDLTTKWTASGVTDDSPAELVLTLEEASYVTSISLAFGVGNERVYTYAVSVSDDGKNYSEVVSKRESEKTTALQSVKFSETSAKYVKFTFYARTDSKNNGWLQVTEAEVYGTVDGIPGAGGVLAQRTFTPPEGKGDYEISFTINLASEVDGGSANPYYAGISLLDRAVSGGDDLSGYAALQLRFEKSDGEVKIRKIASNYFNEGSLVDLFDETFPFDSDLSFKLHVMPQTRRVYVTVSDGSTSETETVFYASNDDEMTRPSRWTGLTVTTVAFNSGAGSKSAMEIEDFSIFENPFYEEKSDDALNGNVRLEATRLESYPKGTGAYFGRYVYHSGADEVLRVQADKDPAYTRFVEREGLIGSGVSFEAANMPGYFMTVVDDGIYLKKLEDTGEFYSKATFIKNSEENQGYYTGTTCSYSTYLNREKYIYDTSGDHRSGSLGAWSMYAMAQGVFYVRSEAANYVSDNFYGDSVSSQWYLNYPWKTDSAPTNDNYNFSGLITKNNVIVENGELFLKATKASGWPKNADGDTGIQYSKWGKGWERWKGYVGVVSIQNKVYNKQCYIEGSFKEPDSPIGYWNAFWLNGRDSWPPEIDIFEFLSSTYGHDAWHTAIHGEGDKTSLFGKQTGDGVDLTDGYHTFALDWGYDYVKFYVDGKLFERGSNSDVINYQKNLRLIINTGIGGWEAEPDDTMVWDDGLRCKYVRSYQY